jgi:D-alanine--poly(phosphoribitol) ligase subunit 2
MMSDEIRNIIKQSGVLDTRHVTISDDQNLYDLGLDSFGTVDLMLAVEEYYGVKFAPQFMRRETFSSIAALDAAVAIMRHVRATT